MTQLAGVRAPKNPKRAVTRYRLPMAAGVTIYKGADVMIIRSGTGKGYYAPADDARIGRSLAKALETVTNSGAAGAATCLCEFYRERTLYPYLNDTGVPLVAADREGPAYVLDDQTVSGTVSTVSGGVLFEIDSEGIVWVDKDGNYAPGTSSDLSDTAPVDPSSSSASAGSATEAARQDHKHHIALATPATEGLMSAAYAGAVHAPVATMTALKAIAAADRSNGMLCLVLSDTASEMSLWRFHSSSSASDTTENLVATPAAGSGRWLRADRLVSLYLPVTKDNADNSTIFTVPTGARIHPREAWWEVTTNWTGGSSSSIGVHASPTGWTTKGDILGGSAGDVLSTLVTTNTRMTGTVGAKLDTRDHGRLIMVAADTFKFDRITDAFTAGAANVRILCDVLANLGA